MKLILLGKEGWYYLKLTNRVIMLSTQFIISFGSGMSNIALLTLITQWFGSANYLGMYSFFLFVPRVVLATYIGSLVDRWHDLKRLLLSSMFATAVFMLMIASSVALEIKHFWWLVFLAILYEIAGSFYLPILTKMIVELFTRQELSKLNASLTTAVTSANLFSGLVVSILIGFVDLGKFLFIDLGLYLCALVLFLKLDIKKSSTIIESDLAVQPLTFWNGFKVVKDFLRDNSYIAPVFYVALIFNIALAPQSVYFAELARKIFIDIKLIGIFDTLFVGGFLVGSICYRLLDLRIKIHQYILAALFLVPVAFLLLSSQDRKITCLGIILLGFAIPLYNISTKTILQTKITQDRLATVSNSYYALMNLTQPLGLLGLPYVISLVGISLSLFWIALVLFLIAIMMLILKKVSPRLDIE